MAIVQSRSPIITKLRALWKYYLLQSLLAATALFILTLVLTPQKTVAVSAMGGTAFIVFAMPKTVSAQTRNVIGGHLVGLASGAIFCFTSLPDSFEYAGAVGIAILLMVALDVEHPPAAGTAVAVVINEITAHAFVAIMVSTLVMTQCRYLLRNRLKDLV